jgi:uncharacterized protein
MENYTRRDFIKGVVGAGVSLVASDALGNVSVEGNGILNNQYDAKGLPTVLFGSTGVRIPRIVLGLGSRFCHIEEEEESTAMLNYALDNGLYYWDTAHIYDNSIAVPPGKTKSKKHIISEERVGQVVQYRREEIFLSTKVTARNPDEAMKEIEDSLRRLQTDRLDMLKIHDVHSLEDVNDMSVKGNLIDVLLRLKEEKVTRFIGFSGHGDATALKEMAKRADFDSMLFAMNHWRGDQNYDREGIAVPTAHMHKMGLLMMKAVRPKETIPGLKAVDLVNYALSLKGPDALVLGMDSVEVVKSNLEILRHFKPMEAERMKELAIQLKPFYRHENLPWMKSDYIDGLWG